MDTLCNSKFYKKGFTLIELLVVISIISLLSSVILASVNGAREKAQISKFVQELKQIQSALELYRADHGQYPLAELNQFNPELPWTTLQDSLFNTSYDDLKLTPYYGGENYSSDLNFPSFVEQVYYFSPASELVPNSLGQLLFSCGGSSTGAQYEYFILIQIKNPYTKKLPLPRLYDGMSGFPLQEDYRYYCLFM